MRRLIVTATLTIAALALAACGTKQGAPPTPATASGAAAADPRTELIAALKKSATTTATVVSTGQVFGGSATGTGTADPIGKTYQMKIELAITGGSIPMEYIIVGTAVYLRSPLYGGDGTVWNHVDVAKVSSLDKLGLGSAADPTGIGDGEAVLTTVERTSPGHFTGVIDGTKRPGQAGTSATVFGDAWKALPFEATVDGQGYLTSITTHIPAVAAMPATTSKVSLSDFGKPVTITAPPASQVKEMPESYYTSLR